MPSTLDAAILRDAMSRFLEALTAHREEVDSLNVFPVPDGDTGTNLLLTQRSVVDALAGIDGADLPEVGEAISKAALMGARGNSGVILSQVLRGLCARLCADPAPGPPDLAAALSRAAREAHRAVARPVEGTMLTVLRDAAEAAGDAAEPDGDCAAVARAALEAAERSLEGTTELLPDLAAAGVVDAGGKGVVLLLDALCAATSGAPLTVVVGPLGPVGRSAPQAVAPKSEYGYEVMYLVETAEHSLPRFREMLTDIGDSVVVVGGGGLYNVHVHTDAPDTAVDLGKRAGAVQGVRVTSLDEQVSEACLAGQVREIRLPEPIDADTLGPAETTQSIVAVAWGPGLEELFRSLGAITVAGGPGSNPAVRDLLAAIESAPGDVVFLLPNHENVIPAAQAAAAETAKEVDVVWTRSIPQGIAAAAIFNPQVEADDNHGGMLAALTECTSAEIAYAEKPADTGAGRVEPGDCLGISGGEVLVIGRAPSEVAVELVGRLLAEFHELLTLYVGEGVAEDEAGRVAAAIREAYPDLEVEVQPGGQPRYPYLIGLE